MKSMVVLMAIMAIIAVLLVYGPAVAASWFRSRRARWMSMRLPKGNLCRVEICFAILMAISMAATAHTGEEPVTTTVLVNTVGSFIPVVLVTAAMWRRQSVLAATIMAAGIVLRVF